MRWVLDYAAQQASGFIIWRRDVDHIEKGFVFGGMPARNGVTAALLVRSGWTGVDDVFSGPGNFFLAYAPTAKPEWLTEKLGERYEIALTDIKKWSVGSPIQAPLDGIAAIRSRRPFGADQVQRVTVRVAPSVAAVVDNRDIPDICLQHMIAVMLLDGTASFQAAHDKVRMKDPAVLRQREKVNLVRDEELASLLPARVTIDEVELTDGTRLSERVTEVRGTAANPMTRAEVIDKARDLIAPVLSRETAERLIETVYGIETLPDMRSLARMLRPGDF
jgi:2-methylcitrate dehydratase PrpD